MLSKTGFQRTTTAIALLTACAAAHPPVALDPGIGTREPISPVTARLAREGRIALHVYTRGDILPPILAQRGLTRTEHLASHRFLDLAMLVIASTVDEARLIAQTPGVVWVEQAPEPTTRNDTVRLVVQSGTTAPGPFDAAGLTGAGEIVGLIDLPLDWNHCAFRDDNPIGPDHRKIIAYNAPFAGISAHGTHVGATLAGDSASAPNLRGVATGARLVFNTITDFDGPPLLDQLNLHAAQGAAVHSNSWGDDQSAVYGGLARAIDAFCWENDDQLVVVAVSNGSTLKTPENAKNALAVAATQDAPLHDRFCIGAAGPTTDGRRKPDLVAPGCSVFSAYPFGSGCPTVFSSGTSMATPAVAGAAAIARQYFTEGRHPTGSPVQSDAFVPSGALLKAVLIAGTVALSTEPAWPGDRQGWGRVQLSGSLPINGNRTLLVDQAWNGGGLETAETTDLRFTVIDPAQPLRIVLAWHDAPGDFGATDPVVNNLDLFVFTPDGLIYRGNRIDPETGESVTGGPRDTRNNVEVVNLSAPAQGEYTARVRGTSVPVGSQGFGLAIVGGVRAIAGPCSPADLAEPYGVLDLSDVSAFATGFAAGDPASDIVSDGVFDLADINAFIEAFLAGCP